MPSEIKHNGRVLRNIEEFYGCIGVSGVLIAIDFGQARLGLARSSASRSLVLPLDPILQKENQKTKTIGQFARIESLHRDHCLTGIVVGLPLTLKGGYSISTQRAVSYAYRLACSFPDLPTLLHDERWSTVEAERRLEGKSSVRRAFDGRRDSVAAQILLENVLDCLNTIKARAGLASHDDA